MTILPNLSSKAFSFSHVLPGVCLDLGSGVLKFGIALFLTCDFFRLQAPLHVIHSFAHLGIPDDTTICSPLPSSSPGSWVPRCLYSCLLLENILCGCIFHFPSRAVDLAWTPIPHCDLARMLVSLPCLSSVLSIFVFGDRHREGHSLLCVAHIA